MTTVKDRKIKVALVADHASIDFGGESALPCHYFREFLRRGVDVHLIVHERSRPFLDKHFAGVDGRIHYIADTWTHRFLHRLKKPLPHRIAYITFGFALRQLTQSAQNRVLKRLIGAGQVDVVHQVIPVSPKEPSSIYGLGVPVVVGPMNGGMEFPPAFANYDGWGTRMLANIGRIAANFMNRLMPGKRQAALLLVANERTKNALPKDCSGRVVILPENGVDTEIWHKNPKTKPPGDAPKPHFIYVGRLVDWKAVDILIDAFAIAARTQPMQLRIIGDGPLRQNLEKKAKNSKIHDPSSIQFDGWLPQSSIADMLSEATALVLPSLYECGGAVVLEAMACGVTVIASNWGGPATYLDEKCGILIAPKSRETLVNGFAEAMVRLSCDGKELERLSNAAEARSKLFLWSEKADFVLELYKTLLVHD
jgi:glycosyltransferase involved in cell wall biosynthesis